MPEKKINVGPTVTVTQEGPKKYTANDKQFTQAHPEYYESFKDHPTIQQVLQLANERADCAIEAEQEMGLLDKDIKKTWPTNVELAKKRTLNRRPNMSKWELALWEAHRNIRTGVPPADVHSPGPGLGFIVEN